MAFGVLTRPVRPTVQAVSRLLGVDEKSVVNAWQSGVDFALGRQARRELRPGSRPAGEGSWLEQLPPDECWAQLAGAQIGRLAFTAHSGTPVILPVNYAVDDRTIVIRSGLGPKLSAGERGELVAFEVDDLDPGTRTGWSVVVLGALRVVRDPAEQAALGELGLVPWAAGPRTSYLRLRPRHVSGRRLVPAGTDERAAG